eukprot:CAMPEP_0179084344 /NCGR_PEP_ID=MMETSP0796-20121207/38139_1 /TAXON_ID=73915 /ORGANISM="Pyrodinium bahamense, Strain pbaha01" /LENGTH=242 /DNA_ID=CAMNT_0020781767 /DNA_START=39 /DNA_END=767 /DNA_ORIENTATION=-
MAAWGSGVGAWQRAAAAQDAAPARPVLFEERGADVRLDDGFGGFAGRGGTASDLVGALVEEVPRVFSAKAHGGAAGDLGLAGPSIAGGFGGPCAARALATGALPGGDPRWVTIFGFPGRAAALVRQQLEALCGPIVEVCHGDGNFAHVRFHSSAAADACLAQNGRALLGKLLVGCVPCNSGLVGSGDQGVGEGEEVGLPPPPLRAVGLAPAGASTLWAGSAQGPKVTRGGLLGRFLDLIFDI